MNSSSIVEQESLSPLPSSNKPPSTTRIVGVEKERVDPYTLQVIEQLFPGHRGIDFLAKLLQLAIVKQLALPELERPETTDVAVITIQNLRKLSKHIGMAYDTTEKYVVVLSQLRLLHKKRTRHQIELHFPLGRCPLPHPEALDMLGYRSKVTSFAHQVKRRIVLLRKQGKTELTVSSPHMAPPFASLLVEDIRKILLEEKVDSEVGSRLLIKCEGVVRHRCFQLQSGLSEEKGDSFAEESSPQSRLFGEKVDSFREDTDSQSRLLGEEGDSFAEATNPQRRLFSSKGDSFAEGTGPERRLFPSKGDSFEGVEKHQGEKSPFSSQKGDFAEETAGLSLNDNVITLPLITNLIKRDNDNDNDAAVRVNHQEFYSPRDATSVGRKLALFLEGSPANTGGFVTKCKQCPRSVIQAAVIDMLVHQAFPTIDPADERGRPRNRASWFHGACNKYAEDGTAIPAWVQKWLNPADLSWQAIDLSWKEIAEQLGEAETRYKRYMVNGSQMSEWVRAFLCGKMQAEELDAALAGDHSIPPQLPHEPSSSTSPTTTNGKRPGSSASQGVAVAREKSWMDEYEAEALAEEILKDAGPFGVSKAVAKQEHGVSVVALTWLGTTFAMKTPQQWRAHFENVRPEFERRMQKKGESNGSTR